MTIEEAKKRIEDKIGKDNIKKIEFVEKDEDGIMAFNGVLTRPVITPVGEFNDFSVDVTADGTVLMAPY